MVVVLACRSRLRSLSSLLLSLRYVLGTEEDEEKVGFDFDFSFFFF